MMLDITSPPISLEIPVKPTEFWHSEQALFSMLSQMREPGSLTALPLIPKRVWQALHAAQAPQTAGSPASLGNHPLVSPRYRRAVPARLWWHIAGSSASVRDLPDSVPAPASPQTRHAVQGRPPETGVKTHRIGRGVGVIPQAQSGCSDSLKVALWGFQARETPQRTKRWRCAAGMVGARHGRRGKAPAGAQQQGGTALE